MNLRCTWIYDPTWRSVRKWKPWALKLERSLLHFTRKLKQWIGWDIQTMRLVILCVLVPQSHLGSDSQITGLAERNGTLVVKGSYPKRKKTHQFLDIPPGKDRWLATPISLGLSSPLFSANLWEWRHLLSLGCHCQGNLESKVPQANTPNTARCFTWKNSQNPLEVGGGPNSIVTWRS